MYKPQVGRPCHLTEEEAKRILEFVPRGLVLGQVARLAKVPKRTLSRWLKDGEDQADNPELSIFTQFWLDFEQKRGVEIDKMVDDVRNRLTNWQASWELLRSIAREDFGADSLDMKELLANFEKLSQDFKQFRENALQRNGHGKLDTKGDQEEGRTT